MIEHIKKLREYQQRKTPKIRWQGNWNSASDESFHGERFARAKRTLRLELRNGCAENPTIGVASFER